jgi:hypothetical protein
MSGTALPIPACVQRYFAFALPGDRTPVRTAVFDQRGVMRLDPKQRWNPFTATESFATDPPSLRWDATWRFAGLIPIAVHDAYERGRGTTSARFLRRFALVEMLDAKELAAAALLRYLAEAVWFPTALLPSKSVRWSALGEQSARVELRDRGITAALDITFGEGGEIASVAGTRDRTVNGQLVPTPWTARCLDYRERAGMMLPAQAEVAWVLDGRVEAYWHGANEHGVFTFADGSERRF